MYFGQNIYRHTHTHIQYHIIHLELSVWVFFYGCVTKYVESEFITKWLIHICICFLRHLGLNPTKAGDVTVRPFSGPDRYPGADVRFIFLFPIVCFCFLSVYLICCVNFCCSLGNLHTEVNGTVCVAYHAFLCIHV